MTLEGKRILIDASMSRGGGGFTYLLNMLPRLAQRAPDTRFILLLRNRDLAALLPASPGMEVRVLPERGLLGRMAFVATRAARIAREERADLYYSVAEYAPLSSPCPVVVSLRNPNVFTSLDQGWPLYQRARLALLERLAVHSARRAARVVFVSHDSAAWMGAAAGLDPARCVVVHHGIDPVAFAPAAQTARRDDVGILSLSSVYRYKNYVRLIEAYGELARRLDPLPPLTIVGDDQDPAYSAQMRAARASLGALAERVRIIGAVPYMDVAAYYAGADLFVFPSYLETFGHPLLEAMAAGLPVVAADIPVFREIAGDAAHYADPYASGSIADAMERALTDADARAAGVALGHARVREFGWSRAAAQLCEAFEEILSR